MKRTGLSLLHALIVISVIVFAFSNSGCKVDPMPLPLPDPDTIDKGWVYDPTPLALNYPVDPSGQGWGFQPMPIPANNPLTKEGVKLGRMLFYDPILSGDSTQACASCHLQGTGFSDERRFSIGIDGIAGNRQAMPVFNLAWAPKLFWDGRSNSLEHQAIFPVIDPIEMHNTWENALEKIQAHKDYPKLFYQAFGIDSITRDDVTKAIAQFERTILSFNSRYDRARRGEIFLTDDEVNGSLIFFSEVGDCFHCHGNFLFTDNIFHNTGLDFTYSDIGLEGVTNRPQDHGKFRTPSLRNIALTAPYMHDGRFQTLEEVIDHYSENIVESPHVDPILFHQGAGIFLNLTAQQKAELKAFLLSLTDESLADNKDFSNPFEK